MGNLPRRSLLALDPVSGVLLTASSMSYTGRGSLRFPSSYSTALLLHIRCQYPCILLFNCFAYASFCFGLYVSLQFSPTPPCGSYFSLSFLFVSSLAYQGPRFSTNRPTWVLTFNYNNILLQHSRALSPPSESAASLFLCANSKMHPLPRVRLTSGKSRLLLLAGHVSLDPGPSEHNLRLGTISARSMQAPALFDPVASKGIDRLGITETWLTVRETSVDL